MNQMPKFTLAGRVARLGAATIDGLLFMGSVIPGVVLLSSSDTEMGKVSGVALMAIAWLSLLIAQAILLTRRGQSLGKMFVGVRIVKAADESAPGFMKVVLLRLLEPALLGGIPVAGGVFLLVDFLFIFRDDRRCLHDLVAETKVINGAFTSKPLSDGTDDLPKWVPAFIACVLVAGVIGYQNYASRPSSANALKSFTGMLDVKPGPK